jgi:hypothetical protein
VPVQEQEQGRLRRGRLRQGRLRQGRLRQEQLLQEQLLLRRMRYTQSQLLTKLLTRRRPKGPYQSEFWTHPK